MQQVLFNELFPLDYDSLRNTCIPVSRQIDEVELAADPIKIYSLRASRLGARNCQPLLARKAIQQTRLADVTASQKRNFRERFVWKLFRLRCADQKLRVHPTPEWIFS